MYCVYQETKTWNTLDIQRNRGSTYACIGEKDKDFKIIDHKHIYI